MSPHLVISIFVFIFGATVGSFLNVLIYRLPRKEDFVKTRSHCTHCDKLIYWYENIPLISFIFLRGKCSKCGGSIGWRYLLVEFISGLAALYLFPRVMNFTTLTYFIFYFSIFCAFLVHFVIDVKHRILPDGVNIYLGLLFLAFSLVNNGYVFAGLGALVGFLFPLGVTYAFYLLRNKVGLGGGDIKLYGVLGIMLGPMGVMYNIMFSCVLGTLISVPLLASGKISRNTAIPFGPFILIIGALQIFFPSVFKQLLSFIFM